MFIPQEVILAKRDGKELSSSQIQQFVDGITSGDVTDAQISALAMATFFNGMTIPERTNLTLAMRDSGSVMQWDLPGPVVDKHSTGGVGDMASLMLGPIVAACGAYVPMITGRGLGHTGGTLDKLESIPGYQAKPSNELFRKCVKELGVSIIGQTDQLAPADKRFYAVRDTTATVESVPLITASILSKKLSEGLDGLVMDVKYGQGAFMKDADQAEVLAKSIVQVANSAGVKTSALLTDMNAPLAYSAGNALEIMETLDYLSGTIRHPGLHEVTMELSAAMLVNAGLAKDLTEAHQKANHALDSGKAAEIFANMVTLLGGPADLFENRDLYLPKAKIVQPVLAAESGYISHYKPYEIGMAVVTLGGGRLKASDEIDHSVGISSLLPVGTPVQKGDPIAMIHANSSDLCVHVSEKFKHWISFDDKLMVPDSLILKRIYGE